MLEGTSNFRKVGEIVKNPRKMGSVVHNNRKVGNTNSNNTKKSMNPYSEKIEQIEQRLV